MSVADKQIIDTCCLLDLYAGWDGLEPLSQLQNDWYICSATLKEARYIRETDADGNEIKLPVDLTRSLRDRLVVETGTTDAEFQSFLELSTKLGDGEAMSLAIALHRDWVLATDDKKAAKMALKVNVEITSTPEIVRTWADLDESNLTNLARVLQNIEKRAQYKPPRNSRLYDWWNQNASG